jgi:predicted HNH restriction endonuclease
MIESLVENGFLVGAWKYNNESPPRKIFPYLVKKRGSEEMMLDVSLSGKSDSFRGMPVQDFVARLSAGDLPKECSIRMKPLTNNTGQSNSWLVRNIRLEGELQRIIQELRANKKQALSTLEEENEKFNRAVEDAARLSDEELKTRLPLSDELPEKRTVSTTVYVRNPFVVAAVLRRAKGVCEACGKDAPFKKRSDGTPYLEVHHKQPLAHEGWDNVGNAVALCPNCHRKAHYGTSA